MSRVSVSHKHLETRWNASWLQMLLHPVVLRDGAAFTLHEDKYSSCANTAALHSFLKSRLGPSQYHSFTTRFHDHKNVGQQ